MPIRPTRIIFAEQLRRFTTISKARMEKKINATTDTAENSIDEQQKQFMESEYLEHELQDLELKILNTAKEGRYEIEVMNFPAAYCTDGGRAINNSDKEWPETLQGKARSFLLLWKERGQPHGYRMKAKINNYPQGFIGDISLFIDWS